jgi:hypothetical protein
MRSVATGLTVRCISVSTLQDSRPRASSFTHEDTRKRTLACKSASSLSYSDRSIPVLARDDAERRPAAPEHLAHVARERERLLVRGEVTAVRVRAREDDVVDCMDLAVPRSASTPSVHTGADARERRLGQLLWEQGHTERERERAHQERFLGRRRVRVLVVGP